MQALELFGSSLSKLLYGTAFSLSSAQKADLTRQLLEAVLDAHNKSVVHRDLKPANILVAFNEKTRRLLLKLCDLGASKILDDRNAQSSCYVCTRWYRAPELLMGSTTYSSAVDLWSLGCLIAEIWLEQPFLVGETDADQLAMVRQRTTNRKRGGMGSCYCRVFVVVALTSFAHLCADVSQIFNAFGLPTDDDLKGLRPSKECLSGEHQGHCTAQFVDGLPRVSFDTTFVIVSDVNGSVNVVLGV